MENKSRNTEPQHSESASDDAQPQHECNQPDEQQYARHSEFDNFVVCSIVGGMIFALLFVGFAIYDFVSSLP